MLDFSNENQFLAQAYSAMIHTDIRFPNDDSRQGNKYTECINLAENVINGMPAEIKEQYKNLLACILKRNILILMIKTV